MTTRATRVALCLCLGLASATTFAEAGPGNVRMVFLEARVRSDPLDAVALNGLSALYIGQMRDTGDLTYLDRAMKSARASLAAVPAAQNPGGLAALAMAEFESHHFREALDLAQQAYGIDPRNAGALATVGDAHLELGNYPEAEKIYAQLDAKESTPSIQARIAHLLELKGDNEAAMKLLARAADLAEDVAWYRVRLGELHFRTGDFAQAEAQYELARRAKPESIPVLEHIAELRAAQGRFEEAVAAYQHIVSKAPRGEFFQALGDLYAFHGKPAEAHDWHERALAFYLDSAGKGNAHYYHHLAGFYSDSEENPVEALRWARKDLAVRGSVNVHEALAWALYKNDDFAKAAAEMDRALALGTRDAHWLFHAALVYSSAGEVARGRELLEAARAINPEYGSFHVHR